MSSPAARGPGKAGGVGHAQSCRAETGEAEGCAPFPPYETEGGRAPGGCRRSGRPLLTCFARNVLSSALLFSFLRATSCSGSARRNRRSAAIPLLLVPRRGRAAGRERSTCGARRTRHHQLPPSSRHGKRGRRSAPPRPPRSALPHYNSRRAPRRPSPLPRAPSGSAARLSRGLGALELRPRAAAFAASLASPALCSPDSHRPLLPPDSPAREPFKSGSGRRPRAGGDGRGSGWPRLGRQERYAPGGSRSRRPSAAVGR